MTHMTQRTPSPNVRLIDWLPLALLALTLIALFHRLLAGEVLFWGLPSLQFVPWRDFALEAVQAGRLPLWNPYNGGGAPLLANYQSALLYPPNWPALLLPIPAMVGLSGAFHLAWAGLGMWRFTGRLGASALGRGLAALAFPLSGTLVARLGTPPMIDAAAWLPWIMWGADRLVRAERPRPHHALTLAAVVAMQLLAGHAQWAFYSLALVGTYCLWRVILERRAPLRLVYLGIALGLGVVFAAPQLLPTAELQRLSQRAGGVSEAFALNFSFAPFSLGTLINPDLFGNPGKGQYFIGGAYFEVAAYFGIIPLIGALGALLSALRRKSPAPDAPPRHPILFFGLAAVVSLVLAFGYFSPIFPFLYRHVPTFNLFQAPARWLLITVFALTAAASLAPFQPGKASQRAARLGLALGLSLILFGWIGQSAWGSAEFAGQLAAGMLGAGALLTPGAYWLLIQPRAPQPRLRWMAAGLILTALDLGIANWHSNPTVPASFYARQGVESASTVRGFWTEDELQTTQFDTFLQFDDYRYAVEAQAAYRASGLPNLNLLDRQPLLNNFDPLRPAWHETFIRLMNDPALRPALERVSAVGPGHLRAWVVDSILPVTSFDEAAETLRAGITAGTFDPARQAVIETLSETLIKIDPAAIDPAGTGGMRTAQIVEETPLQITVRVETPSGGALILADTYYPGWNATLDGVGVPIYRANVAFRAVILPPGNHFVVFTYAPAWLPFAAAISLGALALCGVWAIWRLARRRSLL